MIRGSIGGRRGFSRFLAALVPGATQAMTWWDAVESMSYVAQISPTGDIVQVSKGMLELFDVGFPGELAGIPEFAAAIEGIVKGHGAWSGMFLIRDLKLAVSVKNIPSRWRRDAGWLMVALDVTGRFQAEHRLRLVENEQSITEARLREMEGRLLMRSRFLSDAMRILSGGENTRANAGRLVEAVRSHYGLRRVAVFKSTGNGMQIWARCSGRWSVSTAEPKKLIEEAFRYTPAPVPLIMRAAADAWIMPIRANMCAALYLEATVSIGDLAWEPDSHDILLLQLIVQWIGHIMESRVLNSEVSFAYSTLHAIGDVVIAVDAAGYIAVFNKAAEQLTGWKGDEAMGRPIGSVLCLFDTAGAPVPCPLMAAMSKGQSLDSGATYPLVIRRDAHRTPLQFCVTPIAPIPEGGAVLVGRDVSERLRLETARFWAATHDQLTSLSNRAAWEERMIELLRDKNRPFSVLYLDLDDFKNINDTCGHQAGDQLLRELAMLISTQVRTTTLGREDDDMVTRMGGDEFSIILVGCTEEPAMRRAECIRSAIEAYRFVVENIRYSVGVSIGVVVVDQRHGGEWDVKRALSMSDAALLVAKDAGKNQVVCVTNDARVMERTQVANVWARKISEAVSAKRFELRRQRIQSLKNPEVFAWEVLVTMVGPAGETYPPGQFVEFAESVGLMPMIDRVIIERAMTNFYLILGSAAYITVNVSAKSIVQDGFLAWVCDIITENKVDPTRLVFEVTESAAIQSPDKASEFVSTMERIGCGIAIDDFGAGHALDLMRQFSDSCVKVIKIDGNLVRDIATNTKHRSFVEAVIRLAAVNDCNSVAEWVEDAETYRILEELGATMVQGFFVHRPEVIVPAGPVVRASSLEVMEAECCENG